MSPRRLPNYRPLFASCLLSWILWKAADSIPIDNGVEGEPQILCFSDAIDVSFQSQRVFQGKLFVKGQSQLGDCLVDRTDAAPPVTNNSIRVRFGTCNIQRQRSVNPRGVYMRSTVVIQFHPIFLTKVDRAYHIQCFYKEFERTVDSELDVSMLTTGLVEDMYPMPICAYSIRSGSFDGPVVQFVRVGDPVYHRWECHSSKGHPDSESPYGMLVHSCFVDDGSGNKVILIDQSGCGMDPYILGHPTYSPELLKAYREAHVFKFADKNVLTFSCQIRLCFKTMDTCRGMTPPKCLPLKTKRSIKIEDYSFSIESEVESRQLEEEEGWETSEAIMDVQAKKLVVFDPEDLELRPRQQPADQSKASGLHQICLTFNTAVLLVSGMVGMGVICSVSLTVLLLRKQKLRRRRRQRSARVFH